MAHGTGLRDRPSSICHQPSAISHFRAMRLLLVGLSHRTAPVELRERVDFQARGVGDALAALSSRGSTREAAIVSTCNRAELYVACDDVIATRGDLVEFVSA